MKKNPNIGARLLWYIFFIVVVFVLYVRYLEATSVFHPSGDISVTPKELGLAYEDVYFRTEDGFLLHGWFVKSSDPKAATVLYFHGNAGNLSDRVEKVGMLAGLGLNVFIIDYRGYGLSDGKPSEKGIYKDAVAAFDYLLSRKDIDHKKIISYGASLGGVVAVDLATQRPLAALIVDSSFTSAKDMAKVVYPFIPSFMVSLKMDNAAKIKSITIPKLFMNSPDDATVPYFLGQKLFDTAPGPKEFNELTGGHNDSHLQTKEYISGVAQFLRKYKIL